MLSNCTISRSTSEQSAAVGSTSVTKHGHQLCSLSVFYLLFLSFCLGYLLSKQKKYRIWYCPGSCAFLYLPYPYSTKRREILEFQSPTAMRFPEGKARRKSRGSKEISRAEWVDFTIPTEFWWITDILLIINPILRDGSGNPSI